ncbi:Glutamate/aspartate transport system substrate-binding protein [Burkholderia vietnamiensis]|nr:Glutamate/aspartate transport system substrate-binding protein [Burkholderia vietnamiensis]
MTNQGATAERRLRKMNEVRRMNAQIVSAKDYCEVSLALESGRAVA